MVDHDKTETVDKLTNRVNGIVIVEKPKQETTNLSRHSTLWSSMYPFRTFRNIHDNRVVGISYGFSFCI